MHSGFDGVTCRKRPLGRPRHRWENCIKMALQEVGCWGTDWIELAQNMDRWLAGTCECGNEPSVSQKMWGIS